MLATFYVNKIRLKGARLVVTSMWGSCYLEYPIGFDFVSLLATDATNLK